MPEGNKKYQYYVLCVLVGAVTLFPVSCSYIMEGGIVAEWIARVEEIASGFQGGGLHLFPKAETLALVDIRINGMNSDLWHFIPGLLCRLSGNVVFAYRIYMVLLQGGTLLASMLLFQKIFSGRESRLPVFFGVLLYMTCPYRIYICYDIANLSQAAAWMALPLYVWAVWGMAEKGWKDKNWKGKVCGIALAALALAGVGYADTIVFLIAAGTTILAALFLKKTKVLLPVAAGGMLFLPGLYRLIQYLFLGGFGELRMPLKSIMGSGYKLGELFSSYVFRNGHPGMGLGMFICLLAGAWLSFVEKGKMSKLCRVSIGASAFFLLLSSARFPWDLVQRAGGWALKLVSLIDTPAVFWGMASACLCVGAACAVERISRYENKLIAYAVPIMVLAACFWVCVYQCNTLTYNRVPLVGEW